MTLSLTAASVVGLAAAPVVGLAEFTTVLASIGTTVVAPALVGALETILTTRYTYALVVLLLGIGLYVMIASENLVKKVIGLNLFQTAIFLFFVTTAYVRGGSVPVVPQEGAGDTLIASPLPHVIVLTAIVVGVALTAVALALIVRIYAEYGTLREDVLREVRADE